MGDRQLPCDLARGGREGGRGKRTGVGMTVERRKGVAGGGREGEGKEMSGENDGRGREKKREKGGGV